MCGFLNIFMAPFKITPVWINPVLRLMRPDVLIYVPPKSPENCHRGQRCSRQRVTGPAGVGKHPRFNFSEWQATNMLHHGRRPPFRPAPNINLLLSCALGEYLPWSLDCVGAVSLRWRRCPLKHVNKRTADDRSIFQRLYVKMHAPESLWLSRNGPSGGGDAR